MAQFADYSLGQVSDLRDELQRIATPCQSLREAAELCLDRLCDEFPETLVLARCYVTIPFRFMPEREKEHAERAADELSVRDKLGRDATVAVLAAARGRSAASSRRHHLAVPILTPECLTPIPLVGRILSTNEMALPWLKRQETLIVRETTGRMAQLILVEDAATTLSSDGSKAVPDQDLVREHGVHSVLAMGGHYLNGGALVLVLFTTESLTHDQATKFTTLVNAMKTATMKAVMATRVL